MADQNCSFPSPSTPIIITSTTDQAKSNVDDSKALSSSCDSKDLIEENNSPSDKNASCNNQLCQTNTKLLFSDPTISSSSENRNGISNTAEKTVTAKSTSFLRPSILTSSFPSLSSKNNEDTKADSSFTLKCPKLKLASTFENSSLTNTSKNVFSSLVGFGSDKNKSTSECLQKESNNFDSSKEKNSKPTLGLFSCNSNSSMNTTSKSSLISVPNFVFGQNLHERVTDSVKSAVPKEKTSAEINSNGTSDMLFTSVITSKEIKENFNNEKCNNFKEPSSLLEDAARCQEARANKRKYEEVLVTTGEEDEQNILQVNVKLFAFDNGAWVERGRGILRLNDKSCDGITSSRIIIRTVGSLRVILNTKIWRDMSLSRASERSARLTAMDPNGQVKIFLLQASLKDMVSLYALLEDRIKLCKEQEPDTGESPEKKKALQKEQM